MLRACALTASLILLAGCGPDLPPGWEDARRVDDLSQAECSGSPYEDFEVTTSAARSDTGALSVTYSKAHFRCEQDVTAFWRESAEGIAILVQPEDMHPKMVAGCDCLYDVTMTLRPPAESGTVSVFRRWDGLNEPNDPEWMGQTTF